MAQTSFALMTILGRNKEAAALANGTTIQITQIAIGDGTTVPSGGETALYHEVDRKTISGHGTVVGASNVAYFDCFLAAADGPYTIREAGLYDIAGDLIAIAKYDPPISKPIPSSGQTVEGTIRLEVAFSDVANVTIKIDPTMQVALQRLTRLPWVPVLSMTMATPPASPAIGDTYLIPAAPTGAWVGQAGNIAEYGASGWAIISPPNGHGISLPDGRVFERIGGIYAEKIALDAQSGKWSFAVAGGTANALTATLDPAPTAYVAGMRVRMKVPSTNTGAMTLNLNGLGAKGIGRKDGADLVAGSVVANQIIDLVYDGARFQALDVVGGSGAFAIGAIRQMIASGTYTTPVGCRAIMVEGLGGGGAGGGAAALTGGDTLSVGGGGGAGGYFRKLIINPAASYAVTIGIGGAAVVGAVGNPGQTTSFGSVASATGGTGGATSTIASGGSNTSNGGSGGTAAGGDVSSGGSSGGPAVQITSGSGFAGIGAAGVLGGAGVPSGSTLNPGGNATGFGSGGGGAVINGSGYPSQHGGSGSPGVVIITEYF